MSKEKKSIDIGLMTRTGDFSDVESDPLIFKIILKVVYFVLV